jgi:hypothetical protein
VAPIDISALRHERATRSGHHMAAHLRTEAYEVYRSPRYPAVRDGAPLSYEENVRRIEIAKRSTLQASASTLQTSASTLQDPASTLQVPVSTLHDP